MILEAENHAMGQPAQAIVGASERPRVLVAEDQEDVIAALRLLLKNNGYDADFVKSPADALTRLRAGTFDAILLDLNYSRDTTSGTEGLELLSQVQALDKTLAVVVMTAWGSVELAVKAMHRGACDFIQKPWDNAELLKVLDQQMQRSKALRQKQVQDQLEQQEAAQMQRALMPGEIAAPAGLTIAASSQSARAVGGDYYDVLSIGPDRLAICIADVVGKGVAAALLMSNLQATVRMLAPDVTDPREICNRVNEVISSHSVSGKFISFFYGVIDGGRMQITYTNAGHNWPILARANGECERLSSDDVVLGTVPGWAYHENVADLRPGDRLVLFTDGITEAANSDGVELGEETLVGLVSQNMPFPACDLKDRILQSTLAHCAGILQDDATLIVVAVP
jgi:sigma-B regulation protein RsbU (phosphoserine phosphatase)